MPRGKTRATGASFSRYDAIIAEANRLATIPTSYSQRQRTGPRTFDCSSACSQLLRAAGYNVGWMTTATAVHILKPGKDPTHRVTFWVKNSGTAHMFAEITVAGITAAWGTNTQHPGHAVSWHHHTLSGFAPFHVGGLDEQASSVPANADLSPGAGGVGGSNNEARGQGVTLSEAEHVSKAAAFATYINLPGMGDSLESMSLTGERSLMNDQPLLPFVQQLCQATLRSFMSLPNGDFFAFFPDYFGGFGHRTPYWDIADIEIIDGQIQLSDEALATHVYTVGDIAGFWDGIDYFDKAQSRGVVTILHAFLVDFLNPPNVKEGNPNWRSLNDKDKAINFIKKYGARPSFQEYPMVRNPIFEQFLAYQQFCLLWSRQFLTQFTVTFMPELYPGGIVRFPDHGLQLYVDEVSHQFDYETGFVTQVNFAAPASMPGAERQNLHAGMIRAGVLDHKK